MTPNQTPQTPPQQPETMEQLLKGLYRAMSATDEAMKAMKLAREEYTEAIEELRAEDTFASDEQQQFADVVADAVSPQTVDGKHDNVHEVSEMLKVGLLEECFLLTDQSDGETIRLNHTEAQELIRTLTAWGNRRRKVIAPEPSSGSPSIAIAELLDYLNDMDADYQQELGLDSLSESFQLLLKGQRKMIRRIKADLSNGRLAS